MKISYSASSFYLLILAAIHESCPDQQWLRLKMMISTILLPTFTSLHDVIRKCFSYLFISMNTWILLLFIGLCLHSQYLFWCSVFSALGRWISKLCPLTYFLHFENMFFLFWPREMFHAHFCLSGAPSLKAAIFPRNPASFYLGNDIWKLRPGY